MRPKDFQDNATPSENSLAADGLLRLAALTGEAGYEERAARWIASLAPVLGEHPTAFAYLLGAFERLVTPSLEVAVVGALDDAGTVALQSEIRRRLLPASVRVTADPDPATVSRRCSPDRGAVDRPTAYVCERYACRRPATDPAELRAQLDAALAARS